MKFVCEDDIFKTFTNTSPVFALNSAYKKTKSKIENKIFITAPIFTK